MKIPPNDFRRQWAEVQADALRATSRVGASGWYVLGEELRRFEEELAKACGHAFAVGVGNGTDAIEIALRCQGLRPGERVLTTPLSAFATTQAILRAGGVPVFADVDASGLLDLDACRERLEAERSSGDPIRWCVPVHLYGHALDAGRLAALRDDYSLRIVEDCAQAILARSHGQPVGAVGEAAALSFYPTKNLGALGDAGALLLRDAGLARRARSLRHYGQSETYVHDELGLNSRLDELHAALLCDALLPRLSAWTRRRAAVAGRYREGIRHRELVLPPAPQGSASVWHLFPLLVPAERRAAFRAHLEAEGVGSGVHYPTLIPDQRAMGGTHEGLALPRARDFARREVSLPIHPFLADAEVEHVIAACNAWSGA